MSAVESHNTVARHAELTAQALLGTDRTGGSTDPRALLRNAAVVSTRAKAGRALKRRAAVIPPCPEDPLPPVNQACAQTLRGLLAGKNSEFDTYLIQEWAELAIAHGRRAPDELVGVLLAWLTNHRFPQESPICKVAGVRGDWLARQNPDWRTYVVVATLPADLDRAWHTGTTADRRALLAALRRENPAAAEPLLRATWNEETAAERATLVTCIATGLSPADETFLEWVLNDRSAQVRCEAAHLLATLPTSQLAARMLDAAALMFVEAAATERKSNRRKQAVARTLEPPQQWNPAWERDGLEKKAAGLFGPRAWWMKQILSQTSPAALAQRLAITNEQLLECVAASDYAEPGVEGLCTGAARCNDEPWCLLLARHCPDPRKPEMLIHRVAHGMSRTTRVAYALEGVRSKSLTMSQRLSMFEILDQPWTPEFTVEALDALTASQPWTKGDALLVSTSMKVIAACMDAQGLPALERMIASGYPGGASDAVQKCVDKVRLRAEMRKEFEL